MECCNRTNIQAGGSGARLVSAKLGPPEAQAQVSTNFVVAVSSCLITLQLKLLSSTTAPIYSCFASDLECRKKINHVNLIPSLHKTSPSTVVGKFQLGGDVVFLSTADSFLL